MRLTLDERLKGGRGEGGEERIRDAKGEERCEADEVGRDE